MAARVHDAASQGADPAGQGQIQSRCGLPKAVADEVLGPAAGFCIADVAIVPQWYGADHALVLFTWPRVPGAASGASPSRLSKFLRPLQSIVGLYPLFGNTAGAASLNPADVECQKP